VAERVFARFVDDDGSLLVKCDNHVDLALAAIVITQALAKMGNVYGPEVAAAAGALRHTLCDADGPPTVIIERRKKPHPHG
jgi:hypothetical protein